MHIVVFECEKVGLKQAVTVVTVMDYDWKYVKVNVTEGALIQWRYVLWPARSAYNRFKTVRY